MSYRIKSRAVKGYTITPEFRNSKFFQIALALKLKQFWENFQLLLVVYILKCIVVHTISYTSFYVAAKWMRHLSITQPIRSPNDSVWKVSGSLANTHLFSYTVTWGFAISQIQIPDVCVFVRIDENVTSLLHLKILMTYILWLRALSCYKRKRLPGTGEQNLLVLVRCYFSIDGDNT